MGTKAQERIEKAKKIYGLAEEKADSLLIRLVSSKWTLAIVSIAAAAILWWVL